MRVRSEVIPFLLAAVVIALGVAVLMAFFGGHIKIIVQVSGAILIVLAAYLFYFFRDPSRKITEVPLGILAPADGKIAQIKEITCEEFFNNEPVVRVSIFLSLFDVHVNRAPIAGAVKFLQYYPGKRFFTFQEKSSDYNQHNSIVIEGEHTRCLINQIVGPVCRRVVHWLKLNQEVAVGERIGMMKFGSRLDLYFPKKDVVITAEIGAHVNAGISQIGMVKKDD